ncbi:MAG: DNA polymerase III subunit delta, partial [Flavobacteriia bacterium]|nr:DNA polymerase III subunit delta [Candidatus Bostrichicola ureolyticus]
MGNEYYYINIISTFFEKNILNDYEKVLNQIIIYGQYTDIQSIITYAIKYPIMSKYTVIIVKEAQLLSNIENLSIYTDNPLKSTILILCYNNILYKTNKLYQSIKKNGIIFHCNKLYTYQVFNWIVSKLKKK